jgi:hypothetical protein
MPRQPLATARGAADTYRGGIDVPDTTDYLIAAECQRIIREEPDFPPGTSDEVLAEAYWLATAQAMINLFGPEAEA